MSVPHPTPSSALYNIAIAYLQAINAKVRPQSSSHLARPFQITHDTLLYLCLLRAGLRQGRPSSLGRVHPADVADLAPTAGPEPEGDKEGVHRQDEAVL